MQGFNIPVHVIILVAYLMNFTSSKEVLLPLHRNNDLTTEEADVNDKTTLVVNEKSYMNSIFDNSPYGAIKLRNGIVIEPIQTTFNVDALSPMIQSSCNVTYTGRVQDGNEFVYGTQTIVTTSRMIQVSRIKQ